MLSNVYNYQCLTLVLYVYIFVELGWRVGDEDEWHHDQIRVDVGLVPTGVSHDSADIADILNSFLMKRKIENWQIYGQAYISMVW